MRIDGRAIAEDIKKDLKEHVSNMEHAPQLAIVYAGNDEVVSRFTGSKQRFGESIGVSVDVFNYPENIEEDELRMEVISIAKNHQGVIIQLPLPGHIAPQKILNEIPPEKDVDVLSEEGIKKFLSEGAILPPVVGAIREIFARNNISVGGRHVVVMGQGRLVGIPVAAWIRKNGVEPEIVCKETPNAAATIKEADILITGVGSPGLIDPEIIKDGAVLVDAGTATVVGTRNLAGDADSRCEEKCSLFTPVPGGIGPITVAMVFKNLIDLNK